MITLAFVSQKGEAGKSTIAANVIGASPFMSLKNLSAISEPSRHD